jgi:hypothetical protein
MFGPTRPPSHPTEPGEANVPGAKGPGASGPKVLGNVRTHARIFRALLHLYPSSFRVSYGDEMTHFFLDRVAGARTRGGRAAVARLWWRTAVDIVRTAALERRTPVNSMKDHRKGDDPMTSLLQDVRYAARRLRMTPLFTISAIAILALGLGLNAAVFSLVDAMLLRATPFANREEIVHVYQHSDEGEPSSTSYPAYRDMVAMTDVFAGVAATS